MYYSNCGTEISDGCVLCGNCGAPVDREPIPLEPNPQKSKAPKIITIVALAIILTLTVLFIALQTGKENLKKQLMKDWSRVEGSGTTYYFLELDFSDDTIEYNFDGVFVQNTLETYEYKVVSWNKIKVEGSDKLYTIEFNDEKTMMTITPALTSSDSYENWFNH